MSSIQSNPFHITHCWAPKRHKGKCPCIYMPSDKTALFKNLCHHSNIWNKPATFILRTNMGKWFLSTVSNPRVKPGAQRKLGYTSPFTAGWELTWPGWARSSGSIVPSPFPRSESSPTWGAALLPAAPGERNGGISPGPHHSLLRQSKTLMPQSLNVLEKMVCAAFRQREKCVFWEKCSASIYKQAV